MTAVQILASLGFVGSSAQDVRGKVVAKVWTSKGWTYQRFDPKKLDAEITAWSRTVEPGTW